MKKLKAFTLMELLVGMIVSSIVIGFGYSGYSVIYRQFLSFKDIKTEIIETSQFQSVFSSDFYLSDVSFFEDDKVRLFKKDQMIQYQFIDSLVLRMNNEITDTFKLKISEMEVTYALNESTMISEIHFKAIVLKESEPFTFNKTYSAETLIKQEQANEN